MKTKFSTAAAVVLLAGTIDSLAQTPLPHSFGRITALPDQSMSLTLTGRVASTFRPYFDIYPIEVSSDLMTWQPLTTLLRTNASTNALIYVDTGAAAFSDRFYRTFTNHFITPLPRPSGPFPVGAISRLLTDPSRTNRYNIRTNSSFMITLWFPVPPLAGIPRTPYMEPKLTATFADVYGTTQSILTVFYSHAVPASSIATEGGPYPVVIYSHGFGVNRRDNTAKFEELASHGYVVVSVDHADARATVFPDGRLLTTTFSDLSPTLFTNNVQDLRFVLATLAQMNQDDVVFKGALDLQRVGTMGWSYGGGVAAEICRTDERVLATVLLDAHLQNATELISAGLNKPFLGMYNAASSEFTLYNKATHDTYWMRIRDTRHQHFADWLAWLSSPSDPGRRGAVAMNACMLSFFDKYLKGEDDHLLDNPTNRFPVILYYLKK